MQEHERQIANNWITLLLSHMCSCLSERNLKKEFVEINKF